jgi:hypothetical protein
MYRYLLALFIMGCFSSACGQGQLRFSTEYSLPLGKMRWSYKPAVGAQLSYIRTNRIDKKWSKVYGLGLGYTQFNPLADTLYYVVDDGGVSGMNLGRAAFSPFKIYMLSAIMGFERRLGKNKALCLDLAVGYYYGQRTIYLEDDAGSMDGVDEIVGRGTFVPRLGFAFDLNKTISISPFVSYTFMLELGSTDPGALDYNPGTGSVLHYYSTGVAFDFNF